MPKGMNPNPDFRKLFESAPGLYLVLLPDSKFTIVAVSESYLKATMTKRESILGRGLFEVFPDNPDDPSATGVANLRASLNRVVEDHTPNTMAVQKYDIQRPESEGGGFEERYWSPINCPVLDDQGSLIYIIHRVEDVTEFINLKKKGTEQTKLTEELQAKVEKTEAEVFNRAQQIQEANKKLQAANAELEQLYAKVTELDELKTQFFANVSHELRTPLALILGPAEKLLSSSVIASEKHDLEVIVRNARILLKHVNDLLDVAKLEAGRMSPDYSEVDFANLLRLVASNFASLAQEKNISFQVTSPKQLAGQADADMIQRVILNLLSNAFKFVPNNGAIQISVGKTNGRFKLEVQDNGPGIPSHLRQAVFERFRQVEGGATRKFGGTGLGLAIAKEFVELHNGTIQVTDAPSGGALFVVELPIRAPAGATVNSSHVSDNLETVTQQVIDELRGSPRKAELPSTSATASKRGLVLVAEDNPDMNRFIVESLSPEFQVATAFDGKDGLVKTVELKPDLILTDIMMPIMSGDQMVGEIRKLPEFSDVPIILLTAKADEQLRLQLLQSGAQDYILKPFTVAEVLARVRNLLTMKRAKQALQKDLASRTSDLEELANEVTLRRTQLQKAISTRDEFLSVASHELRTPLSALKLQLQMTERQLRKQADSSPQNFTSAIELSLRQVSNLTHLVEQLLDVSRIRLERMKLDYSKFNFAEEIRKTVAELTPSLAAVQCSVELDLEENIEGEWDAHRIDQIVTNLLSNACKYAPGKPVKISVSKDAKGSVVLTVEDKGPGIVKEMHRRIFERFERGVNSQHVSGLGLGLFITKSLVEAHGGHVRVESEPGMGSKFIVEIPALPSHRAEEIRP